jgi:hypothetical protein
MKPINTLCEINTALLVRSRWLTKLPLCFERFSFCALFYYTMHSEVVKIPLCKCTQPLASWHTGLLHFTRYGSKAPFQCVWVLRLQSVLLTSFWLGLYTRCNTNPVQFHCSGVAISASRLRPCLIWNVTGVWENKTNILLSTEAS